MMVPTTAFLRCLVERGFRSTRTLSTSPRRLICSSWFHMDDGGPAKNLVTTAKIRADDGVELYYERRGTGPHALVLIPGALGSVDTDFPPQMDYFGREGGDFTVVGFDPRGYGKSRPHARAFLAPEFYRRDARDAAQVMEALGLRKFSVLGWSDGGVSGIIAAALFPERVQKLVVWGSNPHVTESDVEMVEKTRDIDQWSPRMRVAMETLYGGDFPGMWSSWMDGFVGVHFDPIRKGDLCAKEVAEVKCPTLVLHGMRDALCPMFHAEYLAQNIRNCCLVTWSEAKHNLHLKHHQEFNKLVQDFLIE